MLVPITSLPHIGVLLQGRAALSMACTEVLLTCIGEKSTENEPRISLQA